MNVPDPQPPKYPLPVSLASSSQAKPMIKMISRMLTPKVKSRMAGRGTRGKITSGDIKVKQKKVKFY